MKKRSIDGKFAFRFPFGVQMFNGDPPPADPPADPPKNDPPVDPPAKPFVTFPDEASFMARISREAKKQVGEFIKGLGFENEDGLKTIIKSHNENLEKSKTDLEKAQEAARKAEDERNKALDTANNVLRTAEAKLLASQLGVKAERIDFALKLADISAVSVKDGVVDKDALKTAIEGVLTAMPELKGTTMPASGGSDFGGGGGGGGKPPITMEYLRTISEKEAEERMDEITAFLAKHK